MIRADIELGGEITQVDLKVKDKESAIEKIWDTYGKATPIIELYTEQELLEAESESEVMDNGDSSE